jgi:putative peptidoglycan lipid II flippase
MIFRSIFTNSFGILTSRILGFIRDLLTASYLGANIYSDLFFVAFKLPNLFRRIFAEGAFTQSFLPSFAASKIKSVFSVSVYLRFLIFLIFFSLSVTLFDKFFTKLIALGFDDKTVSLAAPLVALNFYYLILIFTVTFIATLLQYKNHFATTAFSTALLNIGIIGGLLYAKEYKPLTIVYYMSYGVLIGGLLQVAVHLLALRWLNLCKIITSGFKYLKRRKSSLKDELKSFYNSFFPAILGNSTAQISAFLDTWLASFLAGGSISYLYYSNRILQLPLALFAIATSVAIFPKIAKYLKNGDEKRAQRIMKKSFWFLAYFLSFSTVGGIMLSNEIIWLLFERGEFTRSDTINSALVLSMYMIGLLPYGLSKIFSLWLYSTHKQKYAAKISFYSLIANVLLSLVLIFPLKAAGLALASSIAGAVLFVFTIKEYSIEKFLDIIRDKLLIYLVLLLIAEVILLYILKGIFNEFLSF